VEAVAALPVVPAGAWAVDRKGWRHIVECSLNVVTGVGLLLLGGVMGAMLLFVGMAASVDEIAKIALDKGDECRTVARTYDCALCLVGSAWWMRALRGGKLIAAAGPVVLCALRQLCLSGRNAICVSCHCVNVDVRSGIACRV